MRYLAVVALCAVVVVGAGCGGGGGGSDRAYTLTFRADTSRLAQPIYRPHISMYPLGQTRDDAVWSVQYAGWRQVVDVGEIPHGPYVIRFAWQSTPQFVPLEDAWHTSTVTITYDGRRDYGTFVFPGRPPDPPP